ncbi:MAG: SPFH domain-containing protein [Deltaproteobacteria bacterium]|nr:SPFH domain-containing protein [Deltaproteobacteria bacterium]
MDILIIAVILGFVLTVIMSAVHILREYERAVVFRLGRIRPLRGPGLVLVIPGIERVERVSLRIITLDVEKQDVIPRDNVSVAVNAVVFFRVVDPIKAVLSIQNFMFATSQLAQTTLRSVAGQAELDELLSNREKINRTIQEILDHQTDPWGIKVTQVEVKHIDLPMDMQRAMAKQAEAERERRARVIVALGEQQASEKLLEAAMLLEKSPVSLQLRYLQSLVDVAAEKNSTIVFPVPVDLFEVFKGRWNPDGSDPGE